MVLQLVLKTDCCRLYTCTSTCTCISLTVPPCSVSAMSTSTACFPVFVCDRVEKENSPLKTPRAVYTLGGISALYPILLFDFSPSCLCVVYMYRYVVTSASGQQCPEPALPKPTEEEGYHQGIDAYIEHDYLAHEVGCEM